ncbi:caspase family protein [Sorangium atrum]|uniref:Caspase family protein n=1 Tax=Sorangium atrum TaxID=2995308 RepID=A0ABT5CDK4_9BACT|nr:caspase family protein [Sorangium aterium]MDC0683890.1 caspase family protein [Sorangium aterium]
MIEKDTAVHPGLPDAVKPALAAAREVVSRLRGGALLVGVEDYKAHDATGGKDLLAGRNDVLAYWKVCRRLGFTHIRVLTSPALTEDEIVRAELELVPELSPGETEDQVKARVRRWLANEEATARAEIRGETADEVADAVARWLESVRQEPDALSVVLREATSSELKEGARWLARGLIIRLKLSWGDFQVDEAWMTLPGIMTYSGHGAQVEGDLALCPTDTGPGLENAVPFTDLRGIFDEDDGAAFGKRSTDNLTVILDCCFAAASDPTGKAERAATLTQAGSASANAPRANKEIGSRVFCASSRDEPSYQAMLGGHWHGAFTWAITVALEQWKIKEDGQFRRSTMSHTELLFRSRMLLQALSFRQHPILVDELGSLPVFHHGPPDGAATSARPDAARTGGQLDPSVKLANSYVEYVMKDKITKAVLAKVLVTNTSVQDNWTPNAEHWNITGARLDSTAYTGGIEVTRTEKLWANGPSFPMSDVSFRCAVYPAWSLPSVRTATFHVFRSQGGWVCGFRIDVTKLNGTWSGRISWAKPPTDSNMVFKVVGDTLPMHFQDSSLSVWSTSVSGP